MAIQAILKQKLWIIGWLIMIVGFFLVAFPSGLIRDLRDFVSPHYDVTLINIIFNGSRPHFFRFFISGLTAMHLGFLLSVFTLVDARDKTGDKEKIYAKKVKIVLVTAIIVNLLLIGGMISRNFIILPEIPRLGLISMFPKTPTITIFPTMLTLIFNLITLSKDDIFFLILVSFGIIVLGITFKEYNIADYFVDKEPK